MTTAQLILIIILTNSGGDGKTSWAEILLALAQLARLDPVVLEVDPGLNGFTRRNGASAADGMDWNGRIDVSESPADWIQSRAAKHGLAIIDTGANFLSAGREASGRMVEIVSMAAAAGARIIFHAVTSPNKPGSGDIAESLYKRFSGNFEFAIIRNNRDGSGAFRTGLDQLGTPLVNVPQISPGLQAYRLSRAEPLLDILERPSPDYRLASAQLASVLKQVAESTHVRSIIGASADERLLALSAADPGALRKATPTQASVRDGALKANAQLSKAWACFSTTAPEAEEKFIQAAREFLEAECAFARELAR